MDLVTFLNARLDEDEAVALNAGSCDYYDDVDECVPLADERNHMLRQSPARALREVEAKRRILAEHAENGCSDLEYQRILEMLAAVYADHPDYDPAWA